MKKILGLILITGLIAAIAFLAFGEKQYQLTFGLQKNETTTLEINTSMRAHQKVSDSEMYLSNNSLSECKLTVQDTQDGVYTLHLEYTKMINETSLMFKDPNSIDPHSVETDLSKYFADHDFFIKVSENGQILEVTGYDAFLTDLINQLRNEGKLTNETIQMKQLADRFNNETMLRSWRTYLDYLPEKKVQIGDQWEKHLTINDPYPVQLMVNHTLSEITQDTILIDVDAEISTNVVYNDPVAGYNNVHVELTGTQTGEVKLDRKTRWIKELKMTQNISGQLSTESEGEKMPIEMEIITEIREK